MAKPPDPFHEFVLELFGPMAPVSIRRMFGGAGVFKEGLMFALIADDTVFLKADPALRAALEAEGCAPFVWVRPSDGKQVDLGYVSLPTDAMDEPDLASEWGRKAFAVALAAKAKTPAKPKPKSRK